MDSENQQPEEQQPETPEAPEGEQPEAQEEAPPEEQPEEAEASADEPEPEGEEEPEEEPTDPGASKEEGKRRRKGGWERRLERAERANQLLMEQLARLQPQQPQQPAAPPKEQTPEEKLAGYVDTLVQQRLNAAREQERQAAAAAELQAKEQKAQAKYEDYGDAVERFARSGASQAHVQAILTSEQGPEIMYAIAKDPEALARFARLPPARAFLEVGRLEAKLASSTATPAKPKSASRPPAPPTSLAGKPAARSPDDSMPFSEWKKALRSKGR